MKVVSRSLVGNPRKGLGLLGSIPLLLLAACAAQDGRDEPAASTSEAFRPIGGITLPNLPIGPFQVAPHDPQFAIHALGKMCLDVGGQAYWAVGAPVTLYWCNGSVAQQFGVHEVDGGGHDVNLRIGNGFCVGARGGQAAVGAVLELQTCNGSDGQQFALDGDSIIAGQTSRPTTEAILVNGGGTLPVPVYPVHRSFVWKPQNDVTNAKAPMVLGTRELTENEYLRFYAVDGSNTPPHSGFVRPIDAQGIKDAAASSTWGTVIEIANGDYNMNGIFDIRPNAGVTIRGYRKRLDNGPRLVLVQQPSVDVFLLQQDDVRLTGLRLEGWSGATDAPTNTTGIDVDYPWRVTVDHMEVSQFALQAIAVHGPFDADETSCTEHVGGLPGLPRQETVTIARNFIHHNQGAEKGYGVSSTKGAFAHVQGNTEYLNRHAIAADQKPESGYRAEDNLVLSQVPSYDLGLYRLWDFDAHGTNGAWYSSSHAEGGIAGDHVEIVFNTFLGTDHPNVKIRGVSCRTGMLDGNVFVQPRGQWVSQGQGYVWQAQAVDTLDIDGNSTAFPTNFDVTANNHFGADDPTDHLGVGDFDGDGVDDVFLGTGNDWFYSSGGSAEWRFLRRMTETASDALIGDIDGDGRADVVRVGQGATLEVSWGGVSSWQFLTRTPSVQPITSYVIGNFDGDRLHGDDIFTSSGGQWLIAPSGRNFAVVGGSSFPMKDLRFGDFTGDGITDVFAIAGNAWSISKSATSTWAPLGGPSSDNLDGYFVADLDGDGIADVARQVDTATDGITTWNLEVSFQGRSSLDTRRTDLAPIAVTGRFDGWPAETLSWSDRELVIATLGGAGRKSRQDMR